MHEAILLKGKEIASQLQSELTQRARTLTKQAGGGKPSMVAVQVGENKASAVYLTSQKRVADGLGIVHRVDMLRANTTEADLIARVHALNQDQTVHGIIIQMPLPGHIRLGKVLNEIDHAKDIEGVHPYNLGRLVLKKNIFIPCTAQAVLALIDATGINLYGAEVVIVGAGKIVGRPLALLLMERMATITVCNIATSEQYHLEDHVRRAEVLIVAAGKAGLIPGDWIKHGATVIDVGINRVGEGIVGDVDFEGARTRAAYLTPVPGGVGPLTVTILMRNVLTAFSLHKGLFKSDED